MKRILIAMLLCVGVVTAQQAGSLVWNPNGSNISVNGPTSAGTAFTYSLPAKSGTFALLSDVAAPATINSGSITLTNGTGTAVLPAGVVRCIVSDPSGNSVKYSRTASGLTVSGVGPVIDYVCL